MQRCACRQLTNSPAPSLPAHERAPTYSPLPSPTHLPKFIHLRPHDVVQLRPHTPSHTPPSTPTHLPKFISGPTASVSCAPLLMAPTQDSASTHPIVAIGYVNSRPAPRWRKVWGVNTRTWTGGCEYGNRV